MYARAASHQSLRLNVTIHRGAGRDDNPVSDNHLTDDRHTGTDPDIILDNDVLIRGATGESQLNTFAKTMTTSDDAAGGCDQNRITDLHVAYDRGQHVDL